MLGVQLPASFALIASQVLQKKRPNGNQKTPYYRNESNSREEKRRE